MVFSQFSFTFNLKGSNFPYQKAQHKNSFIDFSQIQTITILNSLQEIMGERVSTILWIDLL